MITASEIENHHRAVGEVTEGICVSGDLPISRPGALKVLNEWVEAGVTHILDTRLEYSDLDFVKQHFPDIVYKHCGTDDDGKHRPHEWFQEGVEFARTVGDGKVLIHCHMGINRGPSMALAILLDRGWDTIEAMDTIHKARPIAAISYAEDAVLWAKENLSHPGGFDATEILDAVNDWHSNNNIDTNTVIRYLRLWGE